jgi:hypothetical protein
MKLNFFLFFIITCYNNRVYDTLVRLKHSTLQSISSLMFYFTLVALKTNQVTHPSMILLFYWYFRGISEITRTSVCKFVTYKELWN